MSMIHDCIQPPPLFISNVLYIMDVNVCSVLLLFVLSFLLVDFVVFVLSFIHLWLFSFDVWGE